MCQAQMPISAVARENTVEMSRRPVGQACRLVFWVTDSLGKTLHRAKDEG